MARVCRLHTSGRSGFSIVELLIVVIVIAILATITIVSFNNIQNRAHDTAVQNDLRQLSKQVQQFVLENNNQLPVASDTSFNTLQNYRFSKNSYGTNFNPSGTSSYYNLLYCRSTTSNKFAFIANSRSGKGYEMIDGTLREIPPMNTGSATLCSNAEVPSYVAYWMYGHGGSNSWPVWAQ